MGQAHLAEALEGRPLGQWAAEPWRGGPAGWLLWADPPGAAVWIGAPPDLR